MQKTKDLLKKFKLHTNLIKFMLIFIFVSKI